MIYLTTLHRGRENIKYSVLREIIAIYGISSLETKFSVVLTRLSLIRVSLSEDYVRKSLESLTEKGNK